MQYISMVAGRSKWTLANGDPMCPPPIKMSSFKRPVVSCTACLKSDWVSGGPCKPILVSMKCKMVLKPSKDTIYTKLPLMPRLDDMWPCDQNIQEQTQPLRASMCLNSLWFGDKSLRHSRNVHKIHHKMVRAKLPFQKLKKGNFLSLSI